MWSPEGERGGNFSHMVRAGRGGNVCVWSMRAHGKINYPRNEDVGGGGKDVRALPGRK